MMASTERLSSSGRLEAFSDGVFAIAITLLVLDLRVPPDAASFISGLAAEWPSYLAFVAAFGVLGLIWLSHHDLFTRLEQVNATMLVRNLLLLFLVTLYSFPTSILAASFREGATRTNQLFAIGIFTLNGVAMTSAWVYLVRVALTSPHLVTDPVEIRHYARAQAKYGVIACALLVVAFAAAFLSTFASIALIVGLPLINIFFYRRTQRIRNAP